MRVTLRWSNSRVPPRNNPASHRYIPMTTSPLPLYHKVYLLLKQRLMAQGFPADAPMPGETTLAAEYGVSRLTIRRSLEALQGEGLIERRQGRGTFVNPPHPLVRPQRTSGMDALMAHLADMGMHTKVRLLEQAVEPAPADIAQRMGLAPGTRVHRARRVRSFDNAPFSLLTTYVPQDLGERISRRDLGSKPLLAIFRDLGVQIAGAEQSITAVLADPLLAEPLEVPIGSALLRLRRTVRDVSGRVVEYLDAAYRPDRYEYRMDMQAHDTPGSPTWLPSGTPAAA